MQLIINIINCLALLAVLILPQPMGTKLVLIFYYILNI